MVECKPSMRPGVITNNTRTHRHMQKTKYVTNTPYVGD